MRTFLLALLVLFLATSCFANERVYLLNPGDDTTLTVTSSKLDTISNMATSASAGVVTVTKTAGAIAGSQTIYQVILKAINGPIYVGDSTVNSGHGYLLATSEVITIQTDNLADISVIGIDPTRTLNYIAEIR